MCWILVYVHRRMPKADRNGTRQYTEAGKQSARLTSIQTDRLCLATLVNFKFPKPTPGTSRNSGGVGATLLPRNIPRPNQNKVSPLYGSNTTSAKLSRAIPNKETTGRQTGFDAENQASTRHTDFRFRYTKIEFFVCRPPNLACQSVDTQRIY